MGRKSKGALPLQIGEASGAGPANPAPEIIGAGEPLEVVELLRRHQHEGRDYAVGDKLTVRPPIAAWLRARAVIAPLSEDPV